MNIFLETKRLIIKAPELSDLEGQLILQGDETVMRYVGSGARTPDDVIWGLEKAIEHYDKYGFSLGTVFEKETGAFVGRAGLIHFCFDDSQPDLEFGYALFREYWGKGYGTELSKGIIDWAFKNLDVPRVLAVIRPPNHASRHVLEKAGMHYLKYSIYQGLVVALYEIQRNFVDFSQVKLVPAPRGDYHIIQNMARFYVYDMSEFLGAAKGWEIPKNGMFECIDFKKYWQVPNCFPFIIKHGTEIAGFVIVNKIGSDDEVDFNMAQFFILSKFKHKGLGRFVAYKCFEQFPGRWEVMVMPGNEGAYRFWRAILRQYTDDNFTEHTRPIAQFNNQERNLFKFDTRRVTQPPSQLEE